MVVDTVVGLYPRRGWGTLTLDLTGYASQQGRVVSFFWKICVTGYYN